MTDMEILNQLLTGNHLEKREQLRARVLLRQLNVELDHRI